MEMIKMKKISSKNCEKCLAKNICTKCKAVLRDKGNQLKEDECQDFRKRVLETIENLFDMINNSSYEEFADKHSRNQSFIL